MSFILCKRIALIPLFFCGGLNQYSVALVYNAHVKRQTMSTKIHYLSVFYDYLSSFSSDSQFLSISPSEKDLS
jgi:hypothetical protein